MDIDNTTDARSNTGRKANDNNTVGMDGTNCDIYNRRNLYSST